MSADTTIRTSSPIVAWYLTTFRGCRVRTVHLTPVIALLGFMLYDRSWVLVPVVAG